VSSVDRKLHQDNPSRSGAVRSSSSSSHSSEEIKRPDRRPGPLPPEPGTVCSSYQMIPRKCHKDFARELKEGSKFRAERLDQSLTTLDFSGNHLHAQWVAFPKREKAFPINRESPSLLAAPGNQDGLRHGKPKHLVHVSQVGLILFQQPVANDHLQAPSYRPGTCSDKNCFPPRLYYIRHAS
jgi:hypothetical protein